MVVETLLNKKLLTVLLMAATPAVMIGMFADSADAGRLKAQIYMTQEKIPRRLTEKDLLAFVRKHRTKRIEETKIAEIKDRSWKSNLVIAFNGVLGALEFELVFYDIQKGVRILVERQSILVNNQNQKTYVERLNLKRPLYKPNRQLELVVEVRRQVAGRLRFSTQGE